MELHRFAGERLYRLCISEQDSLNRLRLQHAAARLHFGSLPRGLRPNIEGGAHYESREENGERYGCGGDCSSMFQDKLLQPVGAARTSSQNGLICEVPSLRRRQVPMPMRTGGLGPSPARAS